jgi:large subunit ribosomal protein L15
MIISDIKKIKMVRERHVRVGRGKGCGLGKTCGRGEKGQKAHSGFHKKPYFEGGQMPLIRRLPKRGFSNVRFASVVAEVNVRDLNIFADGATVDIAALKAKGLLPAAFNVVKILGQGKLERKLNVVADNFSEQAVNKIQAAGGSFKTISGKPPLFLRPKPKVWVEPAAPAGKDGKDKGKGGAPKEKGKKGEGQPQEGKQKDKQQGAPKEKQQKQQGQPPKEGQGKPKDGASKPKPEQPAGGETPPQQ